MSLDLTLSQFLAKVRSSEASRHLLSVRDAPGRGAAKRCDILPHVCPCGGGGQVSAWRARRQTVPGPRPRPASWAPDAPVPEQSPVQPSAPQVASAGGVRWRRASASPAPSKVADAQDWSLPRAASSLGAGGKPGGAERRAAARRSSVTRGSFAVGTERWRGGGGGVHAAGTGHKSSFFNCSYVTKNYRHQLRLTKKTSSPPRRIKTDPRRDPWLTNTSGQATRRERDGATGAPA